MPRSYSPNKFHSRYHQMGDHPLFHNGSTAKLFPAINTLSPDRISEMYGVATVDRQAEREKEMVFHEPLTTVAANYTFREVDSPVRDQVRSKLSSRCGTANSTAPTGRIGSQPSSPLYQTTSSSRPPTSATTMTHQQLSRPPPFISGGNPKIAREQMSSNGSIFTGFDVDEDLKQEKFRKQTESTNQQMKICCLSPTIIREAGLNSSSSHSRPGTRGGSSNGGGQQRRPQSQGGQAQSPNSMRGSPRSGRLGSSGGSRPNTAASIEEDHLLASVKSTYRPFTRGTVGSAQDSLVCKSYLNSGDNETAWSIRMLESQRVKNRR